MKTVVPMRSVRRGLPVACRIGGLALLLILLLGPGRRAAAQTLAPRWRGAWTIASTPQTSVYDQVRDLAVDAAGNVYAVGQFAGTATFGNGITATSLSESNGFIAKYDPAGQCQWVVTAYDTVGGDQDFRAVTCDAAGNVYALGNYSTQCRLSNGLTTTAPADMSATMLVKLNAQGQGRWLRHLTVAPGATATTQVNGVCLRADARGHLLVAGVMQGQGRLDTLTVTANQRALWVAQFDTTGAGQWARVYGEGVNQPLVTDMAVTPDGETYLVGDYVSGAALNFGAGLSISNGNFGATYLARLRANGTWAWARGSSGLTPRARSVATNRLGQVFISTVGRGSLTFGSITTPASSGWVAAQVMAYDTTGAIQWLVQPAGVGSSDAVGADQLVTDAAGDLYAADFIRGTITFPGLPPFVATGFGDTYVAKFAAATGQVQWVLTDEGQGSSLLFPYALADAGPAGLVVGGEMLNGTVRFGATTLQVSSSNDPCIARVEEIILGVADDRAAAGVRAWPNPARGQLHLSRVATSAQEAALTDVLGRVVRHWALPAQEQVSTLDLGGVPGGFYLLRVGGATRRVVVE